MSTGCQLFLHRSYLLACLYSLPPRILSVESCRNIHAYRHDHSCFETLSRGAHIPVTVQVSTQKAVDVLTIMCYFKDICIYNSMRPMDLALCDHMLSQQHIVYFLEHLHREAMPRSEGWCRIQFVKNHW